MIFTVSAYVDLFVLSCMRFFVIKTQRKNKTSESTCKSLRLLFVTDSVPNLLG